MKILIRSNGLLLTLWGFAVLTAILATILWPAATVALVLLIMATMIAIWQSAGRDEVRHLPSELKVARVVVPSHRSGYRIVSRSRLAPVDLITRAPRPTGAGRHQG